MAFISKADAYLVVTLFLGAVIGLQAWSLATRSGAFAHWDEPPGAGEDLDVLATELFDVWAVPFEVLSVILLIALVGALAIAIKDRVAQGPGGGV